MHSVGKQRQRTDVQAGRTGPHAEHRHQGDKVRDTWAHEPSGPGALDTKNGIGFLHVPAVKNGQVLVEKGTSTSVLNDGVAGYYTDPVKATLRMTGKKGKW